MHIMHEYRDMHMSKDKYKTWNRWVYEQIGRCSHDVKISSRVKMSCEKAYKSTDNGWEN